MHGSTAAGREGQRRPEAMRCLPVKSGLMTWRKWSAGLRLVGTARPASAKKSMARLAAPVVQGRAGRWVSRRWSTEQRQPGGLGHRTAITQLSWLTKVDHVAVGQQAQLVKQRKHLAGGLVDDAARAGRQGRGGVGCWQRRAGQARGRAPMWVCIWSAVPGPLPLHACPLAPPPTHLMMVRQCSARRRTAAMT